jgi:hypothetical protein
LEDVSQISRALLNPGNYFLPDVRTRQEKSQRPDSGPTKKKFPSPLLIATPVRVALEKFWNSAELNIDTQCLPSKMIKKLELNRDIILQWAHDIWRKICDGTAPWLPHGAYLKLFQIRGNDGDTDAAAFGQYDVIIFDEAQDANPCLADIIMRQKRRGKAGLIVVGDPYQRIYGFRGANNELFNDKKFPCTKGLHLTWSFRFGDRIAQVANGFLRAMREPVKVNGARHEDKVIVAQAENVPVPESILPCTIIFRKNVTLVDFVLRYTPISPEHKIYLRIQKNLHMLFETLRNAYKLYHYKTRAPRGPLRHWKSWAELQNYVEVEAEDSGVQPILSLIVQMEEQLSNHGFLDIVGSAEKNVLGEKEEHLADIILITAHQAKGLEWDRVIISGDFNPVYSNRHRVNSGKYWREEMCIFYMAVTRARKELRVMAPAAEWIVSKTGWSRCFLAAETQEKSSCEGCLANYSPSSLLLPPLSQPLSSLPVEDTRIVIKAENIVQQKRDTITTYMCLYCARRVLSTYTDIEQREIADPVIGKLRALLKALSPSSITTAPDITSAGDSGGTVKHVPPPSQSVDFQWSRMVSWTDTWLHRTDDESKLVSSWADGIDGRGNKGWECLVKTKRLLSLNAR